MPTKTTRKTPTRKSNVARPKSKSALNSKFTFSRSQLAIVIGLVLVIGGVIVWRVLAATSQTEVETWTASGGNTKTVADNTASGGNYLEFLTPTVSTTVTPTTGFPTPATTGWQHTGVTLTNYTGPSNITTPGTVIDSKLITTCLQISAPNVTIKRSKIACSGDYGILSTDNGGIYGNLLIEDIEILPSSAGTLVDAAAVWGGSTTMRRVYIHGTTKGIKFDNSFTIEDSWIGGNVNATDNHTTAIACNGGCQNAIIRHNTLRTEPGTNASSAMSLYDEAPWGSQSGHLIENNLFSTSGSYCVYIANHTNITFRNNKFNTDQNPQCGLYGASVGGFYSKDPNNIWANNTWYGGPNDGKIVNP